MIMCGLVWILFYQAVLEMNPQTNQAMMTLAIWISVGITLFFGLTLVAEAIAFGKLGVVKNKYLAALEIGLQLVSVVGFVYYILGALEREPKGFDEKDPNDLVDNTYGLQQSGAQIIRLVFIVRAWELAFLLQEIPHFDVIISSM